MTKSDFDVSPAGYLRSRGPGLPYRGEAALLPNGSVRPCRHMSKSVALRVRLFAVSYSPLAAILAVTHSQGILPPWRHVAFWAMAVLAVAGLLDARRLPKSLQKKSHRSVTLTGITDEGAAVAAYIATYLLPFLGFDLADWRSVVALVLYLSVLLVVFLQTDLALVNPALYLAGWKVIGGKWEGRRVLVLLPTHCDIHEGQDINVVTMDRFFILDETADV